MSEVSSEKLKWKDFLLFIKRKYYKNENIKDVGDKLRDLLNVTQTMISKNEAYFSEDDYLNNF